jgi:predicted enzyme related to lactoylglutathione lyase
MHASILLPVIGAVMATIAPAAVQAQQAPQPVAPRAPIKTPLGREPQQVLLSKVTVSDLVKSYAFYTQVIGLKRALTVNQPPSPEPSAPAPGTLEPVFLELALNFSGSLADPFFDLVIQRGIKPTPETAKLTVIGFKVPDAPAVIARAKAAGYKVLREAAVVGPGEMSIGMLLDPDGYQVEVIQSASYPAGK